MKEKKKIHANVPLPLNQDSYLCQLTNCQPARAVKSLAPGCRKPSLLKCWFKLFIGRYETAVNWWAKVELGVLWNLLLDSLSLIHLPVDTLQRAWPAPWGPPLFFFLNVHPLCSPTLSYILRPAQHTQTCIFSNFFLTSFHFIGT